MISLFSNKTITIVSQVPTVAVDGTTSYADLTSESNGYDVFGSFQQLKSSENIKYGREAGTMLAKVYIPNVFIDGSSITLNIRDNILVDGYRYIIISVPIIDVFGANYQSFIVERTV